MTVFRQTSASAAETAREPVSGAAGTTPGLLGGRYRLEERLGEGGLGVVWRARHLGLQRDFALKVLRTAALHNPRSLARFQREAEALGRLRHPNVVEVTDFGVDADTSVPYLVMELLPGQTLADLLRETGPLPAARALPLLEELAAAVDAAHGQGILHRDLKPGNVALVTNGTGEPVVKVFDFGLAEIADPSRAEAFCEVGEAEEAAPEHRLTRTGALLGTPLYVAPEVIRGAIASRASDIYAVGVIAYEMLAGRPPFEGPMEDVLAGHLRLEPPAPPLATVVWQALCRPLQKDPARRPQTAGGFVRHLRQAVERAEVARWHRVELPRRAGLATTVATVALAAGLLLPPGGVTPLERRLDDLRMETAPPRAPDPRILLVTIDESSLRTDAAALGDRADEVAKSVAALFAAGARGVAVDLLLPARWQRSHAFAEVVLRHPDTVTLAAFSGPGGKVVGTECLSDLTTAALVLQRSSAPFGFVNLEEDADGMIRTGRLFFRDEAGERHPSWAARAASVLRASPLAPTEPAFRIDHRIDGHLYEQISWLDLPATLEKEPQRFRGRLVLVGGDFPSSGDDAHRVPMSLGSIGAVSSLTLQALQVDTIIAGLPVREAPRSPILLLAALAAGGAALIVLLRRRAVRVAVGLLAAGSLYTAISLPVFLETGLLLPITSPCVVVAFGLVAALALRRVLAPIPTSRR